MWVLSYEQRNAPLIATLKVNWRLTEPHIEGTIKSFVFVQYWINLGRSG